MLSSSLIKAKHIFVFAFNRTLQTELQLLLYADTIAKTIKTDTQDTPQYRSRSGVARCGANPLCGFHIVIFCQDRSS